MTRAEAEEKCQAFADRNNVDFFCETFYPIADDVDLDDREEFDEDGDYIPIPRSNEPDGYTLALEMRLGDECYEMTIHISQKCDDAGHTNDAVTAWLAIADGEIKRLREQKVSN